MSLVNFYNEAMKCPSSGRLSRSFAKSSLSHNQWVLRSLLVRDVTIIGSLILLPLLLLFSSSGVNETSTGCKSCVEWTNSFSHLFPPLLNKAFATSNLTPTTDPHKNYFVFFTWGAFSLPQVSQEGSLSSSSSTAITNNHSLLYFCSRKPWNWKVLTPRSHYAKRLFTELMKMRQRKRKLLFLSFPLFIYLLCKENQKRKLKWFVYRVALFSFNAQFPPPLVLAFVYIAFLG